ncbi:hypothetical protein EV130_11720 [Rhizobium azibense]|uniref:Uncharacterized protein n=1 Tax=Rhizobium azibense TaxID=1136135 RepID=A0A4R3Q8G3_9HYPH|nr:hypothetical protein EV130_11720 [Rhizobium azibense]TCU34234.1 hypothetical protein EV129_113219 [Rhizobium azibense]
MMSQSRLLLARPELLFEKTQNACAFRAFLASIAVVSAAAHEAEEVGNASGYGECEDWLFTHFLAHALGQH